MHRLTGSEQMTGQARAVASGALDTPHAHPAKLLGPVQQLDQTRLGRDHRSVLELSAKPVDRDGCVRVLVCVDADDDVGLDGAVSCCHRGIATSG